MGRIEIGAFEAKTHFSSLLREVENGTIVHITRRGKPVAVLRKETESHCIAPLDALANLSRYRKQVKIGEIISMRDEGRKI
jgi:hypothetical protein